MASTFMGLETSKRGLTTQQSGLYTTGHNIANANSLGYTRQRVNLEASKGYPATGLNAATGVGQIGTGVQAGSVQRVRDQFIDRQYRQETSKLGYWDARSTAISQMEDIMAEPSDYGLNESLNQFWSSLQDLNTSPESEATRKVVVQKGIAIAESFNYISSQLTQIQGNIANEIGVLSSDSNSILKQIASINEQIQTIEPNGYMPNDLYDARDVLIDELAAYYPIDVSYEKTGGNSQAIAEGIATVSLKLADGTKVELVNGKEYKQFRTTPSTAIPAGDGTSPTGPVEGFQLVKLNTDGTDGAVTDTINVSNLSDLGVLKSLINSFGYNDGGAAKGVYPDMLAKLDKLALAFVNEFNSIHGAGTDLKGVLGKPFFVASDGAAITASSISIDSIFESNSSLLAASNSPVGAKEEGNGANALLLSNLKFNSLTDIDGATIQTYYESIIGQLGVNGEQASRLAANSETIKITVSNNRASMSSVSLDEEMTNMITFQQAYNANARMITVVDEMLDKIINGMGRVGL